MTRLALLWPLALLAACNGDDKETTDTDVAGDDDDDDTDLPPDTDITPGDDDDDDTTTTIPLGPPVMRDCPTTVGLICPYAGSGQAGSNGDDHHRLDVWFSNPMSIAFPPPGVGGRPVIADWNNHQLRAVNDDPADGLETIMGTSFLGDGDPLLADRTPAGALGTDISLNHPTQQMYSSNGMLLSASWHTHKFREWDPATGIVHVVLGSRGGYATDAVTLAPVDFAQVSTTTLMNQPKELYIDPNNEDHVYYVDMRNERIRMWDRYAGTVNTIVGETVESTDTDTVIGSKGYCGEGVATSVCLNFPKNANPEPGGAIALSADSSTMWIADSESHVIRVVDLTAVPPTISLLSGEPPSGDVDGLAGLDPHPGFADGPVADARWNYPTDFAYDANANALFVADTNNNRIRMIDLDTMMVSTVAGNGDPTCPSGLLVCPEQSAAGDGAAAVDATLYRPFGVDLDPDGNLVISDTLNNRLRIVYR